MFSSFSSVTVILKLMLGRREGMKEKRRDGGRGKPRRGRHQLEG